MLLFQSALKDILYLGIHFVRQSLELEGHFHCIRETKFGFRQRVYQNENCILIHIDLSFVSLNFATMIYPYFLLFDDSIISLLHVQYFFEMQDLLSPLRLRYCFRPEPDVTANILDRSTLHSIDESMFLAALQGKVIYLSDCQSSSTSLNNNGIQHFISYAISLCFLSSNDRPCISLTDGAIENNETIKVDALFILPSNSEILFCSVVISERTPILICESFDGGYFLPHRIYLNRHSNLKVPLQQYRELVHTTEYSSIAAADLVDFIHRRMHAVFCDSNSVSSDALIIGRSGSGRFSVIIEAARRIMVPFFIVTASSMHARLKGKNFYDFPASKGHADPPAQRVHTAFMYAVAMSPCVLIFEDLHRLCSSSAQSSSRISEVRLQLQKRKY